MSFGLDCFSRERRNFFYLSFEEMGQVCDALRQTEINLDTPKKRESGGRESKSGRLLLGGETASLRDVLMHGDGYFVSSEEAREIGERLTSLELDYVETQVFIPATFKWETQVELLSEKERGRIRDFAEYCLESVTDGGFQVIGSEYVRT
jgi:hypothetical protein